MLNKVKATKKKLTAIKEAIVTKVPTLKDKELTIKRWFKQEKRNCFCKDFEGELPLTLKIEAKSVAKPKLSETLKSITGNHLGKVQVANKIKATRKKLKLLSNKLFCKSSNTKRQGIKIKRWFKQEKRNCFC
ncbi:hypothetical protein HYE09_03895 [Mycoplasmopsis bovis]|nr:hypothetical protein [Mycoplasmopsis bovis]QQH26927.1 hypothetical protein HYE09_03895 [Mycoplasmopsis bovis]